MPVDAPRCMMPMISSCFPCSPAPVLQATDGAFNALALTGMNGIERSEAFNASYTCDETDPNICWRSESDFDTGDIAWWVGTTCRYRTPHLPHHSGITARFTWNSTPVPASLSLL